MLIYIYIASLIIGGVFLGASLFLGEHDSDHDVDGLDTDTDVGAADVDADADADADIEAPAMGEAPGGGVEFSDLWIPFTSLRFWVFFLAFFGLTGTVLTLLALAGTSTSLISALGLGGVSGFAAATIIRKLRQNQIGSVAETSSYRGLEGEVLLPLSENGRGKIRLSVQDNEVDLIARSDDESLPVGARVLVIDFRDNEALVTMAPGALPESSQKD